MILSNFWKANINLRCTATQKFSSYHAENAVYSHQQDQAVCTVLRTVGVEETHKYNTDKLHSLVMFKLPVRVGTTGL
jgi:hypothetical protein